MLLKSFVRTGTLLAGARAFAPLVIRRAVTKMSAAPIGVMVTVEILERGCDLGSRGRVSRHRQRRRLQDEAALEGRTRPGPIREMLRRCPPSSKL